MKLRWIFFLAVVVLASCSEGVKSKYTIDNVELFAEGPLFSGPNTLQATHAIKLDAVAPGLTADRIESVKLTKAQIGASNGGTFDNVKNLVLQVASTTAAMQKAGVLNPVPKGTSVADLTPAAEAEMKDNFSESEIFLILDADLENDLDSNLMYMGNFEFEITYKK
jgi:hypothetical protein